MGVGPSSHLQQYILALCKNKRLLFLSKDIILYRHASSMEKPKHMCTYSVDRALTFFKGDNSGTVNKI